MMLFATVCGICILMSVGGLVADYVLPYSKRINDWMDILGK